MALGQAVVEVVGDTTRFRSDVKRGVQGAMGNMSSSLKQMGAKTTATGKTMSRNLTLPLVGAGVAVLKTAGDFEFSMNKVAAITGESGKSLEALEQQAKDLGATTQFSAGEAADAMTFLGMAGYDAQQILNAMPGTLDLAAAGNMELAQTADIVSNVLTGFGKDAEESGRLADIMAKTITTTNTDMMQLGDAMKYVAPVAQSAGVSLEETSAAIGLLGNAGIQGSMAGTTLRGAIARLLNTTPKTSKALKRLGVEVLDSSGNMLPLVDIVDQLGEAGATTGDLMQIFGQRAGPGMAALIEQGSDALAEQTDTLGDAGGTAKRIADKQMEGLRGAMLRLKAAGEAVAIAIGDTGLLGNITGLAEKVGGFLSKLSETNPTLLKVGVIIAGVVAAAGPLLVMIGMMTTGFGAVAGAIGAVSLPIVAVIAAIGALVAAFVWLWNNNEDFREGVKKVWAKVQQIVGAAIGWLRDLIRGFVDAVTGWWDDWGGDIMETARATWDQIYSVIKSAIDAVVSVVRFVVATVEALWRTFGDVIMGVARALWGSFARLVRGTWENIKQVIEAALRVVRGIFEFFAGLFTGDWSRMWGGIQQIVSGAWSLISGIFQQAVLVIQTILSTAWEFIRGIIQAGMRVWLSIVKKVWGFIRGQFVAAKDAIVGLVRGLVGTVIGWYTNLYNRGTGIVRDLIDAVVGFFTRLWDRGVEIVRNLVTSVVGKVVELKDRFVSTVTGLRDRAVEMFTGLKDRVVDTIEDLFDTVRGIKDTVLGFFSGAKDWLLDAGRNIVTGLIDGVKDMIPDVGGAVSNVVSAVTDRLPWSPAKTGPLRQRPPEEGGRNIVTLMASGIQSEAATLGRVVGRTLASGINPDQFVRATSAGTTRDTSPPNPAVQAQTAAAAQPIIGGDLVIYSSDPRRSGDEVVRSLRERVYLGTALR